MGLIPLLLLLDSRLHENDFLLWAVFRAGEQNIHRARRLCIINYSGNCRMEEAFALHGEKKLHGFPIPQYNKINCLHPETFYSISIL